MIDPSVEEGAGSRGNEFLLQDLDQKDIKDC